MAKLPKAPLRRFFDETEIQGIRVTRGGLHAYRDEVENFARALALASTKTAVHGGRITVNKKDIELVTSIVEVYLTR